MPNFTVIAVLIVSFYFLFTKKKKVDLSDLVITNPDGSIQGFGLPSINQAKAQGIANRLWDEMGSTFITSEAKVLSELQGLNQADYVLVFDAFGLKPYDTIFSGSGTFWGKDQNLTQWISHEITSSSNLAKLKTWFPSFF